MEGRKVDLKGKKFSIKDDSYENYSLLILLFWLKIILGIVGGSTHYLIQSALYSGEFFNIDALLQGSLLAFVIFGYFIIIHLLIVFIIYIVKSYSNRFSLQNENIWIFTLRYFFIYFSLFLISACITFYLGF